MLGRLREQPTHPPTEPCVGLVHVRIHVNPSDVDDMPKVSIRGCIPGSFRPYASLWSPTEILLGSGQQFVAVQLDSSAIRPALSSSPVEFGKQGTAEVSVRAARQGEASRVSRCGRLGSR
jgi:hypothetical protein